MTANSATVTDHELLIRQHKAYFPIVNEPQLLAEYALGFFGPDGEEPLLSEKTTTLARQWFEHRCSRFKSLCELRGQSPCFTTAEADYEAIPQEDLQIKADLILQVIEDPEHLLGFIAGAFGPGGPDGLATTDPDEWDELDYMLLFRMPYPSEFSTHLRTSEPSHEACSGLYRHIYGHSQKTEKIATSPPTKSSGQIVQPLSQSKKEEPLPPLIEPEVVSRNPDKEPDRSKHQFSTMEIVGFCALGAGVAVAGALAVKGLGKLLESPTARSVILEVAQQALGAASQQVFVGPRGGRYTVTANGRKNYNVA